FLGLLAIFFPLLFELLVLGAAHRGRVNLHAAQLRLQRLIQKLVDLWLVHGAPSVVYAGVRAHRRSADARSSGPQGRCRHPEGPRRPESSCVTMTTARLAGGLPSY